MKVIGGEERLKEIKDSEAHVCPACDGTGYGDIELDQYGNAFPTACTSCGGCGDDEEWQRFLDRFFD